MEYPESVLTKNKKGETEVRNLISRGEFVLYDYRDPKTFKQMENKKRKLYLKHDNVIEEYYIIPTQMQNRELLIKPKELDEKTRMVWNSSKKKEEPLWL